MNPINLPTNPADPFFLKHCFVCQDESKPGQEFIRNYGGIACFSCRAFWRRAHQKTKSPNFYCKNSLRCVVTVQNRTKCKKCRYERCCLAGMTPDAILTEEQRKMRFRKALKKKTENAKYANEVSPDESELETSFNQANFTESESSQYTESARESIFSAPKYASPAQPVPEVFKTPTRLNGNSTAPRQETQGSTTKNTSLICRTSAILSKKVEEIVFSYEQTLAQIDAISCSSFIGDFNNQEEVLSFCQQMERKFKQFAQMQRPFSNFSQEDQEELLFCNTPLYAQLHIASCLVVPQSNSLNKVRLEAIKKMFKSPSDFDSYVQLVLELNLSYVYSSLFLKAILCYILLFEFDKNLNIQNMEKLEDLAVVNSTLVDTQIMSKHVTFSLSNCVTTLRKMAQLCSTSIANVNQNGHDGEIERKPDITSSVSSWTDTSLIPSYSGSAWKSSNSCYSSSLTCLGSSNPIAGSNVSIPSAGTSPKSLSIAMPYTEEEEAWINNQFELIEDAFRSVCVGDDLLNEFIMYSFDVPLSKRYFVSYFSVVNERMRRILKIHPQFEDLPIEMQQSLIQSQCRLGLGFFLARAENFSNGFEQIRNHCGTVDLDHWKQTYLPVLKDVQKLKRVSIRQNEVMDQVHCEEYKRLAAQVRQIVLNMQFYKINLLVLLTSVNSGQSSPLSQLHSKYQTILRRRLEWEAGKPGKGKESKCSNQLVGYTDQSREHFEKIADILDYVTFKCTQDFKSPTKNTM